MHRAFVGFAAVLVLAGCTAQPAGPDPAPVLDLYDLIEADIGTPIVAGHNHEAAGVHSHSYRLDRLALLTGRAGPSPPTEFFTETAVRGDYAYLCRLGPEAGLVIFDVRDLARPKAVGYLHLDAGFEPDIEVSEDGLWGFWATQRFPLSAQTPTVEPGGNAPRGVHILDLRDKSNPRWAGFSPTWPDGPHSITYANIGGRHILLQSVYAMAYAYLDQEVPQAQRLVVSELDTSTPVPTLRTLAEYRLPGATGAPGLFPHDVSVSRHPLSNRTLAYIAYWDAGVVTLDLTDPASPTLVSQFTDFSPAPYKSVHMARAFGEPIDGRVVVVVEPEIGSQPDSGYLTFVDMTDPAKPSRISSWRLPGNLTSEGGALGPHYFDVNNGSVALASYHAGFWVIDVHNAANLARPRSVAFAEVNATGPDGPRVPSAWVGGTPMAFDAWWHRGHVIGGDVLGGLAVYRFTPPVT